MKTELKKLLVLGFILIMAGGIFAEDAVVTYVKGKVEIKKGQEWVSVQRGDKIKKSDILNTGFESEAKIKIMESVLYLGPVTRIALTELSTTGNKDNVSVYLKTGAVRSKVSHTQAKRVNYSVNTAVAVASCRGTDWTVDDSNVVTCFEGVVSVAPYVEQNENTEAEVKSPDKSAGDSGSTQDVETDFLSDDGGILVKENQIISVSENQTISPAVNSVVQSMNNVVSANSTAAAKESVTSGAVATEVSLVPEVEKSSKTSVSVQVRFGE